MSDQHVIDPQQLNEIVIFGDVRAELDRLATENEQVTFDYENQAKEVRSHIYRFRQVKGNIERERKRLKADALEFGRRIDGAAKELTAKVEAMIAVHQEPLDRIAEREEQRQAAIQQAIDVIAQHAVPLDQPHTAEQLAEAIRKLEAMKGGHEAAVKREAEAAELERLRREEAERQRREREAQIAREAEERAKREVEARAQAEREAATRREQELREKAERQQREAEEAARRAQAEADRRVREERERLEREQARRKAEAEQRAADERHAATFRREAAQALATNADLSPADAERAIDAIDAGHVAHVRIEY